MFADNIEVEAAYEEDAEISQVRKKENKIDCMKVFLGGRSVVVDVFDGSLLSFFVQARILPLARLLLSFVLPRV